MLTLPVFMYRTSVGYELQVASISALLLMVPGIVLLILLALAVCAGAFLTFDRRQEKIARSLGMKT